MTLADRIAVFMDGRIAQVGTPREVFARPESAGVAGFVGTPQMNLMPGTWQGTSVVVDGHELPVGRSPPAPRTVTLGVRPSDMVLAAAGLPAHVERIEDLGDSAIVSLTTRGRPVKVKCPTQPAARSGDDVFLSFQPEAAHLFDPQSGARI
jgi:ABC-type sugar transport system ATPase subunit